MSKKLKIVGLAVFAVCAFMAVSASAALAVPNWTVEKPAGTVITPAAGELNEIQVKEVTVAPTLEVPGLLSLKGTGVALTKGFLVGPKNDKAEKIVFSGVEVESNANCTAKGLSFADPVGTISTRPLVSELVTIGTTTYDTFQPETEVEGQKLFVEIEIAPKSGVSCPVSGKYKIFGTILGTVPASGVLAASQPLTFTKADEVANKATHALFFGKGAVESFLTTTVDLKLASGLKFGVDW